MLLEILKKQVCALWKTQETSLPLAAKTSQMKKK